MKQNDPAQTSVLEWLVFPSMGGVPFSMMTTAGIISQRSGKVACELPRLRGKSEKNAETEDEPACVPAFSRQRSMAIGVRAILPAALQRLLGRLIGQRGNIVRSHLGRAKNGSFARS
jgi:hypothetical protein